MPSLLTRGEKLRISKLRSHLLIWYESEGRNFSWRNPKTSVFEKICVEVLLQRTRAETVARIYDSFFGRFNNWSEIATASIDELEEHFKSIGLWKRRAIAIRGLSTYAAEKNGWFPTNDSELTEIPGVGQYIANAILLFQYGQPRPLLDAGMARVLERYQKPRELADIRYDPWLQATSHWLVRGENPEHVNWAVLDLASAICTPRVPRCPKCPLENWCNKSGL